MKQRFFGKPAASIACLAILLAVVALATIAAAPPNLRHALETQRELTSQRPQDPAVWNDLGNLLQLEGQTADAEAAYRRAVELDPKKPSALFNLGLLEQQQGHASEAADLFRRVLEVDPRHAWAHYQMGTLHEQRGEKQAAIQEYSDAFALDPQLSFVQVNPQVVESRLMTESMLRAYQKGMHFGGTATRQYDDPTRITKLLVERPPAAADEAPHGTEAGAAGSVQPTVLTPGNLPAASKVNQASPPGQTQPMLPTRPGSPNTYYNPTGAYSVPGVGVPSVPGSPGTPTSPPGTWARPNPRYNNPVGTPGQGQQGVQPGTVVTPPPGGVYYRPNLPSTGQLSVVVTTDHA